MTDLHCHILPGMDDGAKNVEGALKLLQKEKADGVRDIMLTSHFHYERTTVEEFLELREAALARLLQALETHGADYGLCAEDFRFQLGAEVYFSPGLCELEADKLCLGETDYLLLELPTSHRPHFIRDTLYHLQSQGILPIIAHIERYSYVMEDLTLLHDWISAGAYTQINAGSILRGDKASKLLLKMIQWNLVHVLGTDAHSMEKRAPKLGAAMELVEQKLGRSARKQLQENAEDVFENREMDAGEAKRVKKVFGVWR